jgi:hypothetical protein
MRRSLGPFFRAHASRLGLASIGSVRTTFPPGLEKPLRFLATRSGISLTRLRTRLGTLGLLEPEDPRFESIQILMAANRTLYYGCPVVPDFRDRIADFWSRRMSSFWFGGIAKLLILAESE